MSEKPEPILSTVLNVLGTVAIVTSAFHFMGAPGMGLAVGVTMLVESYMMDARNERR